MSLTYSPLPERPRALHPHQFHSTVCDAIVRGLTSPCHDLQSSLNDVSGSQQSCGRDSSHKACSEQLGGPDVPLFISQRQLHVCVHWEVDGREWNVPQETR